MKDEKNMFENGSYIIFLDYNELTPSINKEENPRLYYVEKMKNIIKKRLKISITFECFTFLAILIEIFI
jgi:hypothetical protein